ncbi:MAG: N-acetylneuraminate synthase family protein [Verrucomicrobiales bacterium]|nr:N-acetylneuraminate synthase family protein [Verrucomicrobiales bacterium]
MFIKNEPHEGPIVIAEIGCNHKGSMELAKELLVSAALFCKVPAVKFQKRTNRELLSEEEYNAPHPNPMHSYGDTYGAHREYLELDVDQHQQLKEWCEELGLIYSSSVWDLTAAKEICGLEPTSVKIPSACNTKWHMLEWICAEYGGEIQVSLGMTTRAEEDELIAMFERHGRLKDLVLFSCTSGYPVAFEDVCLGEITRLRDTYAKSVKAVGFSGHHLGIAVDIAAITLGAELVERHFTLDRTFKGTDHAASLEPNGMRKLVRDVRNVSKAFGTKSSEILEVEAVQREKLKSGDS